VSEKIMVELNIDQFRETFNKYTRKAFQMIPEMNEPRILDIGCGSGVPTLELAILSDGVVIGIDIDQPLLDKLKDKIKRRGFLNRVKSVNCSLFDICFPNKSFDILWVEGVITIIGFEKGLKEWKRLLTPNGFLVVHDDIKNMEHHLELIAKHYYKLIYHFLLPKDAWWKEYYEPLEYRIMEFLHNSFFVTAIILKIKVMLHSQQGSSSQFVVLCLLFSQGSVIYSLGLSTKS